jgi:hypothetical protein
MKAIGRRGGRGWDKKGKGKGREAYPPGFLQHPQSELSRNKRV